MSPRVFLMPLLAAVCMAATAASSVPMSKASGVQLYTTGTHADYLADAHSKKGMTCDVCHPSSKVSDGQTEIDGRCIKCHGTYDKLGQKDLSSGKTISAHAGHLSIDSCTTCHAGHIGSFAYCNNCHVFKMDMKYGRQRVAYRPQDLSIFKNAVPNRIEKADFVIIGAGGAGMAAAIEARKLGLKTVLLEKMPIVGGSSLLSTGGMNVADSHLQREAGVNDSVDAFVKDTLKIGKGKNDIAMVKELAQRSASALEWIEGLGAKLDLDPGVYGGCSAARMHFTKTGGIGRYMVSILRPALVKSGADVRVNSQVVRLNKDKNGRVTGVLVKGRNTGLYEIDAPTVLLSTGSYANNGDLVAKYHPEFFGMVTSAQPGSHGDGIKLAEQVGAKVENLDRVQVHPNIASGTSLMITLVMRTNGGILVNKNGERFCNDNAPRNEIGAKMLAQPAQKVYLIYDDAVVAKRSKVHKGYVKLGLVKEGNTPEELARQFGIPEDKFAATMKRYAGFAKNKKDEDFGRKELPQPLTTGKLYGIDVVPAIGGTLGGVRALPTTEVINAEGLVIPGLLAAGEVVGNWHGMDRYGGNAVCGNIVFGRLAAQKAAEIKKSAK